MEAKVKYHELNCTKFSPELISLSSHSIRNVIQCWAPNALGTAECIVQTKAVFSWWHYIVLSQVWPPLEAATSHTAFGVPQTNNSTKTELLSMSWLLHHRAEGRLTSSSLMGVNADIDPLHTITVPAQCHAYSDTSRTCVQFLIKPCMLCVYKTLWCFEIREN